MANIKNKSIIKSTPSVKTTVTRGVFTENTKKYIDDGEIFFDTTGKGIWMGVYVGPDKPIKVVEISSGSGNGSISEEDLAKLISVSDIVGTLDAGPTGSVTYTDKQVLSAKAGEELRAMVVTNQNNINNNTWEVEKLKKLFEEGSISPEIQEYIKKMVVEAELESSPTVTVSVTEKETLVIDVNSDEDSIGKVETPDGGVKLGTVWASYMGSSEDNSDDSDDMYSEGF